MARITGEYLTTTAGGEEVAAFVPHPLPPADPPLVVSGELAERLRRAEQGLTRLDLAGQMVPSVEWFLYAFVRKEAVVSSQIEGTQATLLDLLAFEAQGTVDPVNEADVEEVCNYVAALDYARHELQRPDGLPLSMRLLNEAHRRLLRGARGGDKGPGEIRRSQNWIGGARPRAAVFVPPPPHLLSELLSAFEKYIHTADDLSPIIRTGLLHVQFETIHPYLDGNGRIGRLLVTLLLEHYALLTQPLLYLSLYFKRHRQEYYRLLGRVRTHGDWEAWMAFFLDAVATMAEESTAAARELSALVTADRGRVLRGSGSMVGLRLFEELPRHPIVTIAQVTRLLATTKPTAAKAVKALVDAGVLVETTGRRRDRTYSYAAYLEGLRAGTELGAG